MIDHYNIDPIRGHRGILRAMLCAAWASALLCAGANALPTPFQPMTFSVDVQGPTVTTPVLDSFFGAPILGSDILTPFPPGPPGPNPPAFGPLPPWYLYCQSPVWGGASRSGDPAVAVRFQRTGRPVLWSRPAGRAVRAVQRTTVFLRLLG